jgi:hypothetical protein
VFAIAVPPDASFIFDSITFFSLIKRFFRSFLYLDIVSQKFASHPGSFAFRSLSSSNPLAIFYSSSNRRLKDRRVRAHISQLATLRLPAVPMTNNPPKRAAETAPNHIPLVEGRHAQRRFGFQVKPEVLERQQIFS